MTRVQKIKKNMNHDFQFSYNGSICDEIAFLDDLLVTFSQTDRLTRSEGLNSLQQLDLEN